MKYTIKESQLRKIIQNKIREALENNDELSDEVKNFQNSISWDEKDFVDSIDNTLTKSIGDEYTDTDDENMRFLKHLPKNSRGSYDSPFGYKSNFKGNRNKLIPTDYAAKSWDYHDFSHDIDWPRADADNWPKNESKAKKKYTIKESQLHKIIEESVKKVLKESV